VRRVREQLAEWLELLLGALGADAGVAWAVVAVGVALLAVVVWRASRGWETDRALGADPDRLTSRSAASWDADADDHAAAGRWADAVRCRYAATVVALVERGVLDDRPGRTVRELDREVADAAPRLADVVADAGDTFERIWYGHADAAPDDERTVARARAAVAGLDARVELAP
jgi:hypothetical protein